MTTLAHRRLAEATLRDLVEGSPVEVASLTDDHRRSLAARFRAVALDEHRRLDAWSVERAGEPSGPFHWSPTTARRVLGNAALRRVAGDPSLTIADAVNDEVTDQLLRSACGYARAGSLANWVSGLRPAALAIVNAEAVNGATQLAEVASLLPGEWRIASSDAYYDVASARTTLRGRRDLVVAHDPSRVVLRLRAGLPGKSAGPGLRADLTIETLADPAGLAPSRIIGLWPEAGVCLAVDGTMDDLRAGARDLVRTAVAQRRRRMSNAA